MPGAHAGSADQRVRAQVVIPVGGAGGAAIRRGGPIRRTPAGRASGRNMQTTRWWGRAAEDATSPAQPSLKSHPLGTPASRPETEPGASRQRLAARLAMTDRPPRHRGGNATGRGVEPDGAKGRPAGQDVPVYGRAPSIRSGGQHEAKSSAFAVCSSCPDCGLRLALDSVRCASRSAVRYQFDCRSVSAICSAGQPG